MGAMGCFLTLPDSPAHDLGINLAREHRLPEVRQLVQVVQQPPRRLLRATGVASRALRPRGRHGATAVVLGFGLGLLHPLNTLSERVENELLLVELDLQHLLAWEGGDGR